MVSNDCSSSRNYFDRNNNNSNNNDGDEQQQQRRTAAAMTSSTLSAVFGSSSPRDGTRPSSLPQPSFPSYPYVIYLPRLFQNNNNNSDLNLVDGQQQQQQEEVDAVDSHQILIGTIDEVLNLLNGNDDDWNDGEWSVSQSAEQRQDPVTVHTNIWLATRSFQTTTNVALNRKGERKEERKSRSSTTTTNCSKLFLHKFLVFWSFLILIYIYTRTNRL